MRSLLNELGNTVPHLEVWLFGSAVDDPISARDIDVALVGKATCEEVFKAFARTPLRSKVDMDRIRRHYGGGGGPASRPGWPLVDLLVVNDEDRLAEFMHFNRNHWLRAQQATNPLADPWHTVG